jgi:hypothetical protein
MLLTQRIFSKTYGAALLRRLADDRSRKSRCVDDRSLESSPTFRRTRKPLLWRDEADVFPAHSTEWQGYRYKSAVPRDIV